MVLDGEEVSVWGLYSYWAQPAPRITICLRDSVHDIRCALSLDSCSLVPEPAPALGATHVLPPSVHTLSLHQPRL